MPVVRVGIIGSHGLGQSLGILGRGESHILETPFGPHAGPIVSTELDGVPVVYVSRHGAGHVFNADAAEAQHPEEGVCRGGGLCASR